MEYKSEEGREDGVGWDNVPKETRAAKTRKNCLIFGVR